MCTPSAPPPPNPRDTAAAQTGTNVGTAIANSMMGMTDQYTPYGNLTYSRVGGDIPEIQYYNADGVAGDAPSSLLGIDVGQRQGGSYRVGDETFGSMSEAEAYRNQLGEESGGFYTYTDPYTGESYQIPRFESHVELSPEQQAILDANQSAQTNLANLADDRSAFLLDYLPQTESLTDQIGNQLYDMAAQRVDPRFAREEEKLRTRLANQGIMPGSEAFDREMARFAEGKNDAYNQLMLQGRGQALSEINTPINQITALLSGSQVTNPNVQMQNPARIPTTDVAGIINSNYQQQMQNYQTELANSNSMMGGLFGAGATLLGAPQGSVFGGFF